ncbi:hypothetical protein ON010_g11475 [Phytophthora cinnamomi]|nr:hypothetical protein ON010_g11475 [Phytophthora cinnamomi]
MHTDKQKELTARLRSVKYLHAIRKYNAAADSLAPETLEQKVSVVVDSDERKQELMELNRTREVIYKTPADTLERFVEETPRFVNSVRVLETHDQNRRRNFFDFGRELVHVDAVTGCQAKERELGGADEDSVATPLFRPGRRVWLYMERGKHGVIMRLAHHWHGPFRVKKKVDECAYELELLNRPVMEFGDRPTDLHGYWFYPVTQVSQLKAVMDFGDRPRARLTPDVSEESQLDFDEELLS